MAENKKKLRSQLTASNNDKGKLSELSLSAAKKNFDGLIDRLLMCADTIVITKHGAPAAVLMSYAAYESQRETTIVFSDESLMRDIRQGLRDLKAKKARLFTLDELFS